MTIPAQTRILVLVGGMLLSAPAGWAASSQNPAHGLISSGHVDEAIRMLQEQTRAAPVNAEAYHLLSRAYFAMERWDQAIAAAERAAKLDPRNSRYHLWLGRAYGLKAENSNFIVAFALARKVRTQFEKAVALDGEDLDARSDLAEFYLEAPTFLGGGKDKARQQAEVIARRDAATAHWIQARLAEKDKNYPAAESEYKAAIQASGNSAEHWLNLAGFYRRARRIQEMEKTIDQAVNAQKRKSNIFFEAASMLFRAGRDFSGAALLLRQYIASNQPVEEAPLFQAHYLLGSILEKQGDKKAAADEYRAALALAVNYEDAQRALQRLSR